MSEDNPSDDQSEERELDEAELEAIRGGGRRPMSDTPPSGPPSHAYVYPPPPSPMAGDSAELETT